MFLSEKRIGVIMGGLSSEREISLKSGKAVLEALKASGLNAFALEVFEETHEGIKRLIDTNSPDVVFIAMHGGFGEDGRLQSILESSGMPYTGPAAKASHLAMDKIASRRLFQKAGLNVPKYRCIHRDTPVFLLPILMKGLKYPLVVKPSDQGSSIGISFVDSQANLDVALAEAFKFSDEAVVEEFIRGREITVSVFDGEALPIVEIIPKTRFFDFHAKYEKGMTEYIVPAHLDENIALRAQKDAVAAYNALGCRHLSRVDLIIDASGVPYCLEVNTIPGMTATSLFPKAAAAAGISFAQLCMRILELACEVRQ